MGSGLVFFALLALIPELMVRWTRPPALPDSVHSRIGIHLLVKREGSKENLPPPKDDELALPGFTEGLKAAPWWFLLKKSDELNHREILAVRPIPDKQSKTFLRLELDPQGRSRLASFFRVNPGRFLAIVLDGKKVISEVPIKPSGDGGTFEIRCRDLESDFPELSTSR